ncbi:FecR family protein [Sulfurimonas sp. NW9]|uniref:FecR family protein n=1 Tax=Sulfurimonas sp. NW9 TaxID=2922728 RepID=UPI003DA8C88F
MKIFKIVLLILTCTVGVHGSIGSFALLKGDVHILRDNRSVKAFESLPIERKDIISTAKNSLAKIVFKDDTVITLGEKTIFKTEEYFFDTAQESKADFKVSRGFFRVITGKIGKIAQERFHLKTRNATIGIRGTVFEGTTGENGDFIQCIEHAIVVCASGSCQDVQAGEYTFVPVGEAPQEPKTAKEQKKSVSVTTQEVKVSKSVNTAVSANTESAIQQTGNFNQNSVATAVTNEVETQIDTAKSLALEYEQTALQAKENALQAAQAATEAANSANEAFSRIVEAKENVTAYEISAYEAAQAAADAAAQAAADAARESAAATAAATAQAQSESAQNTANDIHQLTQDVTNIETLASEELNTARNQADIATQKSNETLLEATQTSLNAQSAQTENSLSQINILKDAAKEHSDLAVSLSEDAQTASDKAVAANLNVQLYKEQAVQIESDAAAKLTQVQNAQSTAEDAATQAKEEADAAAAARAAAAAAASNPGPDTGPGSGTGDQEISY